MLTHERAWDQLGAGRAGADRQLAQAGHRPRGGPVDVRRTASGRAPPLDRRESGPRAARTGARPGGRRRVQAAAHARFEQAAYALRAEGQALTADRLNALCEDAVAKVWGDAVTDELGAAGSPGRRCRTSSWRASTLRLHLRVPARRRAGGPLARARLRGALRAFPQGRRLGVARELLAIVGVDLGEPEIWNDGFSILEGFVERMS